MKFEIPWQLPGMNEIIDAAKRNARNYKQYAAMKDTYTSMIAWIAKKLPKYERVRLEITWYEPNNRRDPDNIMGGQKFILDGLVVAGTIPDDKKKYIDSIVHKFEVDKNNPRVEVEIEERRD